MGLFFASKVEKTLSRCKKKGLEVLVRYVDSSHYHKSKIIRVVPEKFLYEGFAETLREDLLEIRVPSLNISFETKVMHMSHDIRGNVIYHSLHPEDFKPCYKVEERHFVYPRVRAGLAWEVEQGTRKQELFVWDITPKEVELVNSTEITFKEGHEFEAAKIKAGNVESLCDLKIKYVTEKVYAKQAVQILGCDIAKPPENMPELIKICEKMDA